MDEHKKGLGGCGLILFQQRQRPTNDDGGGAAAETQQRSKEVKEYYGDTLLRTLPLFRSMALWCPRTEIRLELI